MIERWKKIAASAFLLFLGLWVAGTLHTFTLDTPTELDLMAFERSSEYFSDEFTSGKRTANNLSQIGLVQTPLPQVLEQVDVNEIRVFEKTAQLSSGTTAFADDERHLRRALGSHRAGTFNEKATGIAPNRSLSLGVSVRPDQFDALVEEMARVGQLGAINVQQQDRTGEFRRLFAQRQSLRKHQDAILKLRGANVVSLDDALKLEQKVRDIEKEVEAAGVQLGDLLDKEPLYNVFVTLKEHPPGSRHDRSFTLSRRLGTAFLWAAGWWLTVVFGVGVLAAAYLSVRTLWPARGATAPGAHVPPG